MPTPTSTPDATRVPSLRESAVYFIRLAALIRPFWTDMTKGMFLGVIVGVLGLVTPILSKIYFDTVYPARDFSLLHLTVIAVAVFGLTSAVLGNVRGYFGQIVSSRLTAAVTLFSFNQLQHLPLGFFEQRRVGEIVARSADMRTALGTLTRIMQTIFVNGAYLVLVPPTLALLNWRLCIVALLSAPLTAISTALTARVARRFMKRAAEANAESTAVQVEALSQIRTVKAMAAEHQVFANAKEQAEAAMEAQLRASAIKSAVGVGNAALRGVGAAVFTWYAWTLILRGELSLGSFIAFSAYLGFLTGPVGELAGVFSDFQQSAVALARAFEYLDKTPEQPPGLAQSRPAPRQRLSGVIALERVTFGYRSDRPVLRSTSVEFHPGSITAIVGNSGAGKSTILRLLARFDDPWSGRVLVDHRDARDVSFSTLRRNVTLVWQDPSLLRGSIRENLTFGAHDATESELMHAVELCGMRDAIDELPSGLNTLVAEWGASLSGGQRQRLALARALLARSPVLLLDEATSQIDPQTEHDLLSRLFVECRDSTIVIVTHRLTTAARAHRVCLVAGEGIAAVGTPGELARTNSDYRQVFNLDSIDVERSGRLSLAQVATRV